MKRGFLTAVSALVLSLVMMIPVLGVQTGYVIDEAGLLDPEERQTLEQQALEISNQYNVGTYIVTTDDYQDYTNGSIYDAADEIYFGWGLAEQGDAILLILSMAERDYLLIAYGDSAKYAFNDDGREYLDDYFLDNFGSDEWYEGFADYLTWSADYLENAKNGTPYSSDNIPGGGAFTVIKIAAVLLIPLIVAGAYIMILSAQMTSVAKATEASTYVDSLQLLRSSDRFTHTTVRRRKIEQKRTSNSSSGRSSGGGSGTSGKF